MQQIIKSAEQIIGTNLYNLYLSRTRKYASNIASQDTDPSNYSLLLTKRSIHCAISLPYLLPVCNNDIKLLSRALPEEML